MSVALAGPYMASAGLLGLAGMAKLAKPADTAGALRVAFGATPLVSSVSTVRAIAAGEVAVAAAAFAAPGPAPAAGVAAWYVAFLLFVAVALRRGWPIASCGCFGRPDTPPTPTHLVLDAAAAVAAAGWALSGPDRVSAVFAHQPWAGFPLALATAVTCGLAWLVFTHPLPGRRARRTAP